MKCTCLGGVLLWLAGSTCLAAPRDPFRPVQEKCATEWQGWRYGGSVTGESGSVALLQSVDQRWHRVAPGEGVAAGWQVTEISPHRVVLSHDGECGQALLERVTGTGTSGGE